MSTIRVNTLQNTTTTDGGISIDNSGHVTIDGQQLPTAGALSNRNLLYNGAMTVSQRGTSGTVSTAGNYPALDRWSCNDGGIAGFTVSQSTDAPTGFANSAKWTCTSTGSATDDAFHEQKLEGQDVQQLAHGTSSAKSFTVSFWVKSNKTGEYSVWIENNDAGRYFTTPGYTINTANTWEYKTITVPGDTAGSGFNNDNGVSLKVRWHLVLRTSFQGTPSGAWSTSASLRGQNNHVNFADSTSNEWYITGVQLEVGSVATPFEHRSYGDELVRCQRYYQRWDDQARTGAANDNAIMTMANWTGQNAFAGILFPTMRTTPSLSASAASTFTYYSAGSSHTINTITINNGSLSRAEIVLTRTTASWVNGNAGWLRMNAGGFFALTAEL